MTEPVAMDYYRRTPTTHLDGTAIFQTEEDRRAEATIAVELGQRWQCQIRSFGALSPVDWYAERHGRLIGVLELKARTHARATYPTVFLNVRKWLALSLAALGLGCPGLFVVRFTDGIAWVRLCEIDSRRHRVAGCLRIVKSGNDIEPVIEVPVLSMHALTGSRQ